MHRRIGIDTRRWVQGKCDASDLGAEALSLALADANLDASQLDRLFFIDSISGDQPGPATANRVAALLGVHGTIGCMDLDNACVGFVSGLDLAARLVATGSGPVALVTSEVFSRVIDPDVDPRAYVVFGDAAAAAIVGPGRAPYGLLASEFGNDGRNFDAVHVPHGEEGRGPILRFGAYGTTIASLALADLTRATQAVLDQAGVTMDQVRWVLPHQPNGAFFDAFLRALDITEDRTVRVVHELGSLGAAAVAVAFDRLLRTRPVQDGDLVLVVSVGAGSSRGAALLRVDR
jgi:3-oxoacyl-(acyl-carrier-protein) synthase III